MWTKSWQDKRPGWTRRIRWSVQRDKSIHLRIDERDEQGENRQRHDRLNLTQAQAKVLWDKYTNGEVDGRFIYFAYREDDL